jgi:hypothetical protein
MGALSPTSPKPETATAARPAHARVATAPRVGQAVVSVSLPLRFVLTGVASLFLGVLLLTLRPDLLAGYHYNQYIIASTHLFTLGFVTSVIMGAMYQLVPVALETKLYSERLARWQFAFHFVGVAGMVWMFWRWDMKQVGHFGSAFAVGVGLFAWNLARTLLRVPRWNAIATAITSALGWLALTVAVGLALAAAKCAYPEEPTSAAARAVAPALVALKALAGFVGRFDQMAAMHAHAHLGGVGFILMLIVGFSCKLVPMFTLSEVQSWRRVRWAIGLLNLGLALAFVGILLRHPVKFAGALLLAAGLAVYLVEMAAILRARKRRVLDWGLRYFVTALTVLGLTGALGVALSWPRLKLTAFTGQLENVYGFAFLAGVVALAILGMLYKIIPFLVWQARYSPLIGRQKVPALADLYSPRLQIAGYWTFLAGFVVTIAATLAASERAMPWGCGLLLVSLAIFAVNTAFILRHLARPRTP